VTGGRGLAIWLRPLQYVVGGKSSWTQRKTQRFTAESGARDGALRWRSSLDYGTVREQVREVLDRDNQGFGNLLLPEWQAGVLPNVRATG